MKYETDSYVEGGYFISDFTLLREMKDRSTESMLVVTMMVNGVERILFQKSLIDLLLAQIAGSGQDLDLVDRFTIEINFENYATTSIRINGWDFITIENPL